MAAQILIVTSNSSTAEWIRQSLPAGEGYRVEGASSAAETMAHCRAQSFDLALLDADLPGQDPADLGRAAQLLVPGLKLVVLPRQSSLTAPSVPAAEALAEQGFVSPPAYLSELVKKIRAAYPPAHAAEAAASRSTSGLVELPWLADPTRAAQHLARLSLACAAQAALIVRAGQSWAYAGQLERPSAQELAAIISRYWDPEGRYDLARFVRLSSNCGQYLLYATLLSGDLVLALVYDAATPFSRIRSQASQLAHALAQLPDRSEPVSDESYLPPIETEYPPAEIDAAPLPKPETSSIPSWYNEMSGEPLVPPADEETSPTSSAPDAVPLASTGQGAASMLPDWLGEAEAASPAASQVQVDEAPVATANPALGRVPAAQGAFQVTSQTPEPVSADFYNLTYTCVLAPRFPNHFLVGDLAARLGQWCPQICLAFGWRLEGLSIRPGHLQCIFRLSPATSPGSLMRTFRQQTTQRIFTDFPNLHAENASGDFWAPGYMILSQAQIPSSTLLRDFIAQTRQRQGLL
ncbi:MAG: IS200/IS605 family transposase [Chloroflexi bacterium]|nr:IS200/IS605 family transposase [Chloroflexota bacterium]